MHGYETNSMKSMKKKIAKGHGKDERPKDFLGATSLHELSID